MLAAPKEKVAETSNLKQRNSEMVIVSNRLPVHRVEADGGEAWRTSPGGLVSALTPILREQPSTWIGWTGISDYAPEPFEHDSIQNWPMRLSAEEIECFYEGFSNRTLWPLYHDCVRTPEYHRRWWRPYMAVNRRFAQCAAEVTAKGGTVWVHDYQLQLVPTMLRELRPDLRISFFLHIPFPPQELYVQLPWRRQILEGLLGADVIGFQTRLGASNFSQLARKFAGASGTREALNYDGRLIQVGAFPISIDVGRFESLAGQADVQEQSRQFRAQLGETRKIILGVDRLDYTKGIDIRIKAYQELLRAGMTTIDKSVMVQVAVPSRERVEEYRQLKSQIEQFVGQVNGEFDNLGHTPIHYLHRSLDQKELVALYAAADILIVTPLRDGMNLVAKEYVATRLSDSGALILSEFTGAAKELQSALLVNPHDVDGLMATMDMALHMTPAEQTRRMRNLRRALKKNDVYNWARTFLDALRK